MSGARRRRLLWLVPIAALFAAGSASLLRYQGIMVPVRIGSGSMAEQLLGPHRLVHCADCGFTFRCGLDSEAPLRLATCPNCGYEQNDLSLATLHDGERVLIDRWAYLRGLPQRGEVVAFVDPTSKAELAVKRVMGLPRETVMIRRGELFINGSLYRKSLGETKRLATLVYDDAFRSEDEHELPPRWSSDDAASSWRVASDGYRWSPQHSGAGTDDWLMYRHWRCYRSPHPRTEESPVADNDAYNQGLSRELHEVTDLLLSCELALAEDGVVALLIHDGRESFTAVIEAKSRTLRLEREGNELERVLIPEQVGSRHLMIEFGVIDEQLLLAIAGETLIRHAYTPRDRPLQPTSRPLGIAGRRGACSIARVQVYRDIFYLNPFRGDWTWASPGPLGDDTYFVLGDNAPLSNDSRHWPAPGLPHANLVGRVLAGSDYR